MSKDRTDKPGLHGAVILFLSALMALNFLDRTNVGFAALRMNGDLGFGPQVFGLGAGFLSIGEAISAVPSGVLAHRIGVNRWIAILAISWGAIAAAMAVISTARSFFLLRLLLGAVEAGVLPCIITYVSGWVDSAHRGRALAVVSAGSAFAAVVGGPLAGWLFKLDGAAGIAGWRWLFLCEGAPAVVAGVVAWGWLRASPQEHRNSSDTPIEGFSGLVGFISRNPVLMVMGLINFCIATSVLASLLWLPLIVSDVKVLTIMQIGWITAAVFLCGAVGMLIIGHLSDRSGRRFRYLVVCLFVAPVGYLVAALTSDSTTRLLALGAGTAFLRSSAGDFFVGATERLPDSLRSSGMGFLAACGGLGGFFGPTLFGFLRAHTGGYSFGFVVLAGLMLLGALLAFIVSREFSRYALRDETNQRNVPGR